MNPENILKNYVLSQYTTEKLIVIKEKLKQDIIQADPFWQIVTRKVSINSCIRKQNYI